MKKIWIALFGTIVSICVILFVIRLNSNLEKNDCINRADDIFQSNFTLLCNNLNEQESDESDEENAKYAYVCFTMFSLTSFSENEEMNKVVHILYDLSERKALYEELEGTSIEKLNKLCQNINNDELLKDVYNDIIKANN